MPDMKDLTEKTTRLLDLLGHEEAPFGVHYSGIKPEEGFGPKPGEIFSRVRESSGQIDWKKAFDSFSCILGNIRLARSKRKAAWISHEECGCMGGGYYAGVYSDYLEMNVRFVSTGVPGTQIEGEHYLPTPESMHAFMKDTAPPPASGTYCVIKPLEHFVSGEIPLVITFFARPEALNGLYSLACFAAGNHLAVVSPFSAACGSIVAWPLVYQQRGEERAVLGGFDISARKFLKTDELTFSVPLPMYRKMLEAMERSALTRRNWEGVRKKVRQSMRVWGEGAQPSVK